MFTVNKHRCTLPVQPHRLSQPPTAKWTRKLLSKARFLTLPCSWHYGSVAYLRSRKCLKQEIERHIKSEHWYILHPYSPINFCWGVFYLVTIILAFVYMPLQVFIRCPDIYEPFILCCDGIAFIDIIIRFCTGYTDEENKLVCLEPKKIALNYFCGTFILDLMSALPFQLIQPLPNCYFPTHTTMYVFKIFRYRALLENFNKLDKQMDTNYILFVTLSIVLRMLMFLHWMTYLHYQVPTVYAHFINLEKGNKWLDSSQVTMNTSIYEKYLTNLYYASVISSGSGNYRPLKDYILPQIMLSSLITIAGTSFFAINFIQIIRVLIYMYFNTYSYDGKTDALQKYTKHMGLPENMRERIKKFVNYKYGGKYFNEDVIRSCINEQMRNDINMYRCKKILNNVALFHKLPLAFTNAVIFTMTEVIYMPEQVIVNYGQRKDCMYMISSGIVAVLNSERKEVAHLKDGEHFGYETLLKPDAYWTATYISLEVTETYRLDRKSFQACMKPYPYLSKFIEDGGRRRKIFQPR